MNPLTLAVSELKPALAGLGKVILKRTTLPVLGCVRIERTREGRIELTGTDLDRTATVQLGIADQGEPTTILVPLEDLANVVKGCGRDDAIIVTKLEEQKAAIRFTVGGQMLEHRCESLPVAEFPPLMAWAGESALLGSEVRDAIHEAFACANTDESRLILNGAYLDSSNANAHYVVGTDGRHLFSANSFKLPLTEPLIVPSHPFLGWKGFNEDGDWRLRVKPAEKDTAPNLEIRTDHWRYVSRSHEGNYPNWRQVIPGSPPTAIVEIASADAGRVIQTIQRIPDHDTVNHTLGIEVLDGQVRLLGKSAKDEPWTRIELPGARANGGKVTVMLNRVLVLSRGGGGDRSIIHRKLEDRPHAFEVEVVGNGAEFVCGQPLQNLGRLHLADVDLRTAGPIGLDALHDVRLPPDGFRFLVGDGGEVAVTQFLERDLPGREIEAIKLPVLVRQLAFRQRPIPLCQSFDESPCPAF